MKTPFEAARVLARTSGMSGVRFDEHCRKEGLIPPGRRICYECWELRAEDLFKTDKSNTCQLCRNDQSGRSHAKAQERTLDTAKNSGEPWSAKDEQFLEEHLDLTDEAIALRLRRTMHSVRKRRSAIGAMKVNRLPPESQVFRKFYEHRSALITDGISITHQPEEDWLAVYCRPETTLEDLRAKFLVDGYSQDIFEQWCSGRTPV
jgi:hypothetical protein